jgi:hypothetical protein
MEGVDGCGASAQVDDDDCALFCNVFAALPFQ